MATKAVEKMLRRVNAIEKELAAKQNPELNSRAALATASTWVWVSGYSKTFNEHWVEEGRSGPYEHFPPYSYFQRLFELLDSPERVIWIEKSRDMMISWSCVAWLTLHAMKTPHRGVLVQTQKKDKVVQLIDYAKTLYKTQELWLQDAFPLKKPLECQHQLHLEFANGSYVAGIPGGADQIRSYHPFAYFNDESSFQPEAGECYNEALAVVSGKIIFNSSAGPGWYADARHDIIRTEES
jgi:hypothetical protein